MKVDTPRPTWNFFLHANDVRALSATVYSTCRENRVISSNELILRWEKRGGGGVGGSNFSYGRAWISARTVHYAMPFVLVNRHSSLPPWPRYVPSSVPRIARRDAERPSLRIYRARLRASASRLSPHTGGTTFAFITILRNSRVLISCQPFPSSRQGWVSCKEYYLRA